MDVEDRIIAAGNAETLTAYTLKDFETRIQKQEVVFREEELAAKPCRKFLERDYRR